MAAATARAARVSFKNDWVNEHVAGYERPSARPGLGVDVEALGTPLLVIVA